MFLSPQSKTFALNQPNQTVTITSTKTPTNTATLTVTPTSTPAPTKPVESTPTSNLGIPVTVAIVCGFFLVAGVLLITLLWFVKSKHKLQTSRTPQAAQPTSERPRQIQEVKTPRKRAALNNRLAKGLDILRELYEIESKTENLSFVPVENLQTLLKQKYPGENIDLQQTAIEIANTDNGFLIIERARYKGYLIKVLSKNNAE